MLRRQIQRRRVGGIHREPRNERREVRHGNPGHSARARSAGALIEVVRVGRRVPLRFDVGDRPAWIVDDLAAVAAEDFGPSRRALTLDRAVVLRTDHHARAVRGMRRHRVALGDRQPVVQAGPRSAWAAGSKEPAVAPEQKATAGVEGEDGLVGVDRAHVQPRLSLVGRSVETEVAQVHRVGGRVHRDGRRPRER